METILLNNTKTDQKMNTQSLPLIMPSEDLKRGKRFIRNSSGKKCLIRFYYVISTGVTLALMDQQYSLYLGYKNREHMLKSSNQLANIDCELVHDAELDHIYVLQKAPRDSYKSN